MLYQYETMQVLATSVLRHLNDVLGISIPRAEPWSGVDALPYFLRDAFQFFKIELLGQPVLFALARAAQQHSLSEVCTALKKVAAIAHCPVIYVDNALASYERRGLIAQKQPFIVPGNQLYLPDLGIDLREYFRQRASIAQSALSPAAQAMLLKALQLQPWQPIWQPAPVALALGYTPMTLSRAVKELIATGLATATTVGRARSLHMADSASAMWEQAKPFMRNPVKRRVWVLPANTGESITYCVAGESALARYSMLAEPKFPEYALTAEQWKTAQAAGARELHEPIAGAQAWQLWRYNPAPLAYGQAVDPLSLSLSLQMHTDDRVQIALTEMQRRLPW